MKLNKFKLPIKFDPIKSDPVFISENSVLPHVEGMFGDGLYSLKDFFSTQVSRIQDCKS